MINQLQDQISQFKNIVEENQSFVIISHNKPDGDTLGANFALRLSLLNQGKKVTSACFDKMPEKLTFLPESQNLTQDFLLEDFDAIIIVDTGAKHLVSHFEKYPELNRTKKPIIIIDHHYSVEDFGTIKIIDSKATSTTSLLLEMFESLNWDITPDMATCLLNALKHKYKSTKTSSKTWKIGSKIQTNPN